MSQAGVDATGEALSYVEMTLTEIRSLDRRNTVFFMAVSPIEVHGPHLPVGTDVFIAEEVRRRVQAELSSQRPELTLVSLPPLYCGADALPVPGSISVEAGGLSAVLYDYAKALAKQEFRYLAILDNHGGPRHQLGLRAASDKAWRKLGFYMICPFVEIYKRMVRDDPGLLAATGLGPGTCGDDRDNHAGTNETSLLLATGGKWASVRFADVPPSTPGELKGLPKMLDGTGALFEFLGAKETGPDLRHLAQVLAWTGAKGFLPYMGAPAKASREAGDSMFRAHVAITMRLLDEALSGRRPAQRPILSALSFLRRLPE